MKQSIDFEDPRYQFGDPIPTTHPGGIHVQILAATGIRAADVSFTGARPLCKGLIFFCCCCCRESPTHGNVYFIRLTFTHHISCKIYFLEILALFFCYLFFFLFLFTGRGASDPFVRVVVGENAAKSARQIFKTKVIKSTLTPKWVRKEFFFFCCRTARD